MTLVSPWQKSSMRTLSYQFRELTKLITISSISEMDTPFFIANCVNRSLACSLTRELSGTLPKYLRPALGRAPPLFMSITFY